MVNIDVISGFLGAGKTTLINKLLSEVYSSEKPVLIENEFGDVSIDDMLISDPDVQVKVLSTGCICCTLKGDFVKGLVEVVSKYSPTRIIVEPTGLAEPEDILSACYEACESVPVRVNSFITVVNAANLVPLFNVVGKVFNKQIADAKFILLNRTNFLEPTKLEETISLIREINSKCIIVDEHNCNLDGLGIVTLAEEVFRQNFHDNGNVATHPSSINETVGDGSQSHDRFDGVSSCAYYPEKAFTGNDINELFACFTSGNAGRILRAKGFLRKSDGKFISVQYVYGRGEYTECSYSETPRFVVIGAELNEAELSSQFKRKFTLKRMRVSDG